MVKIAVVKKRKDGAMVTLPRTGSPFKTDEQIRRKIGLCCEMSRWKPFLMKENIQVLLNLEKNTFEVSSKHVGKCVKVG